MSARPFTSHAARRRLPERYASDWRAPFDERAHVHMAPGCAILDLGGGATAAIPIADRPDACRYVGLDISAEELARAPEGTYDETHVADAGTPLPALEGRFDLIVSWQVLEHVRSLDAVFRNCHAYLRPGGALVALFSGRFAFFALAGRVVPHSLARAWMRRLLGRAPESVFPAYYDQTWYSALERRLATGWENVDILPLYRGAGYLRFAPSLQRVYVGYENWAHARDRRNLATHYLVHAVKEGDVGK